MPSHQDRVKQNYCSHVWPTMGTVFIEMNIKDGRKCLKCNVDWNKVHKKLLKQEIESEPKK